MTERKNYDLAEIDTDLAKKMSSDEGYTYAFHQDKNGKKGNEDLSCQTCGEQGPIFFEFTRTDNTGTEPVLEGKFCSYHCCAFAYLVRATKEDEHAAQTIETSMKTRIKTLKNNETSDQAKTLHDFFITEKTRTMLNKVEMEYKADQPMQERLAKYLNDVELQGFTVANKNGEESEKCLGCTSESSPEAKQQITETTFEIKNAMSSSRKVLATVTHCGNIECLLTIVQNLPEVKQITDKGAQPLNDENRNDPIFALHNITLSWVVAATNLQTKHWLQQTLSKVDEVEELVLKMEKETASNENSTNEDIAKVSNAVKIMRVLKDGQTSMKAKLRGETSQRTNSSNKFQTQVKAINNKFDPVKANLEETEADKALRAKNIELQNAQNLAAGMNETIATLKKESATLAKETALKRIQTLSEVTKAIDMKEIAEAKAIVIEQRSASDKKIALQINLASDVATTAQKLNDLGLPWLNINIDFRDRKVPFIDPLTDETFMALNTLTEVAAKVVEAKKEQRNAKKQLLQILLDKREMIKKEEKTSNEHQKEKNTSDTEIEKLRTENEILKQQSKNDTAEIAEKKTRIALLESTIEKNKAEIARLTNTLNENNQLLETLLENNKNEDTTQNKKQKRGDKGSDDDMKNSEGKKSKKDAIGERKVQFDESMQTQLNSNPSTPNYSPDRNASTPPRRSIENSDPNEPQYSPASQHDPREDKMPDLEPGDNSQSSTTNPAIEKSRSLLERMRKSSAPEDNNWQNVDKRNNTSKRDTRNNDAAQRDQRSEKNRETEFERHPNPMYGSNYGPQMPGPQMQQWGPPPRSMVAQWGPPPPGWAAYPPGNWGSQGMQFAQQQHFPPLNYDDRSNRGSGERNDRGSSERNDRGSSERNDRNDDRNDREQPRNGRFDKRDCNYWLADQECPRGDSCNFLHTPNKRGTQMNAVDRFKEYQSRRPPRKE
jgi:hypothetical protein